MVTQLKFLNSNPLLSRVVHVLMPVFIVWRLELNGLRFEGLGKSWGCRASASGLPREVASLPQSKERMSQGLGLRLQVVAHSLPPNSNPTNR